MHFDKIIM